MAGSEDTEITLGTGKMLTLFFGLVIVCALFFGIGFSLGRNSARPALAASDQAGAPATPASGVRPSAVKTVSSNSNSSDPLTFYKAVEQKPGNAQLSAGESASGSAPAQQTGANTPAAADPLATPPLNGYYVQVAAVSKQEDAEALVDALKKKQYPAFVSNSSSSDKLFRVQIGPYADIKDAEVIRAKLVGDGYNPILKK